MGDARLTAPGADLDPAALAVIDRYLDQLAGQLPAAARLSPGIVAELREDLLEATAATMAHTPDPAAAARAAIAEFGDAATLAEALRPELLTRQARRTGIALVATGPLVGASWLSALYLAGGATPPVWHLLPLLVIPLLLLGIPATVLMVASTGRLSRWCNATTTLASGTVAGFAVGAGDLILLAGSAVLLLTLAAAPSWLLLVAAAASLARLMLVGRAAARLWGSRNHLTPAVPA